MAKYGIGRDAAKRGMIGLVSAPYVLGHGDLAEKLRQQVGFLRRSADLFDQGIEDEALRLAGIIRVLLHDTGSSQSLLGQLGVKESFDYLDTSERIEPRNILATMGLVAVKVDLGPSGFSPRGTYVAPFDGNFSDAKRKRPHSRSARKTNRRKKKSRPQQAKPETAAAFLRGAVVVEGTPLGPPDPSPFKRQTPFAEWWNDPVTKDSRGATFARRNYVLGCANKEGGAHVDPSLDAEWADLTRNNSLHWQATSSGIEFVVAGGKEIQVGNPALASVRQIAYEVDQTLLTHLSHLL